MQAKRPRPGEIWWNNFNGDKVIVIKLQRRLNPMDFLMERLPETMGIIVYQEQLQSWANFYQVWYKYLKGAYGFTTAMSMWNDIFLSDFHYDPET